MYTTLLHQYQLTLSARGALYNYLQTIDPQHLTQQIPSYNNVCISMMMTHIADTYLHWLMNVSQEEQRPLFSTEARNDVQSIREMFEQVDLIVNDFVQKLKKNPGFSVVFQGKNGENVDVTPLELFTHVITHEFHHKGQVLNMTRQMGYTPVDTDVIRTS